TTIRFSPFIPSAAPSFLFLALTLTPTLFLQPPFINMRFSIAILALVSAAAAVPTLRMRQDAAAAATCDLKTCVAELETTVSTCKTALSAGINLGNAISCITSAVSTVEDLPASCGGCLSFAGLLQGVEGLI
ncbi:hypothetical protein C8R46DRAFT_115959, partial [Mycena filopes]